jgi:undecaprenyl-diphosphatase
VRSAWATDAFLVVTDLGRGQVVTVGALVLAVVAWRRCPPLASLILFTAVARPILSSVLKGLVDRPRPDLEPLVAVGSSSFPSGHALAAAMTWAFVPLVVAAFTTSRRLRSAAFVGSWLVIVLVAVSRVYLGAHWTTDVVGALLVGVLVALVVPHVAAVVHDTPGAVPCRHRSSFVDPETQAQARARQRTAAGRVQALVCHLGQPHQ